ncbi:hypothetical protein [Nocardioides flavescens]|uniref:Uncharacterized protein n=1 Tax=Nocardioides flavescens TaxID=2691959 RepID=A0A6L7F469_9ACTN|nr:hypothetical protein [Nocardioides flavescens]MXG92053.1 hypothetical protein [Nocardioides flavescens]
MDLLLERGLICEWWRNAKTITPTQVAAKLTDQALEDHLDNYSAVHSTTPFISLTAGVRMRTARARGYGTNRVVSAQRTALTYATRNYTTDGHIFAGWVPVLPHSDVALQSFAEEVRDLNQYAPFRRFHGQGEVTAKIQVPTTQLAWLERWDLTARPPGSKARRARPVQQWLNPRFVAPDGHAAIREVL